MEGSRTCLVAVRGGERLECFVLLDSEWAAAGVLGVYQEAVGPECVERVGIFRPSSAPDLVVHGFRAGGHAQDFRLLDVPTLE